MRTPLVAGAAAIPVNNMIRNFLLEFAAAEALSAGLNAAWGWFSDEPPSPNMPAADRAAALRVVNANDLSPEQANNANIALQQIANEPEVAAATVAAVSNDAGNALRNPALGNALAGLSEEDFEALSQLDLQGFIEGLGVASLDQAMRRRSRRADRSRVSREIHEWRYCWRENKINEVYDLAGMPRPDTLSNSYAAFVGSKKMRRMIQRLRILNRCLRSRGVKKVLEAFGNTEQEFFEILADQDMGPGNIGPAAAEAALEFNDILESTPFVTT